MNLPKLPKFKLRLNLIIKLLLLLVILTELYFSYSLLYKNLNPQPTDIILTKIVKVDVNAYREVSELIKQLEEYIPEPVLLDNPNPFKYNF